MCGGLGEGVRVMVRVLGLGLGLGFVRDELFLMILSRRSA